MTRFLAYVSPAVGHTLPLVPGLLELRRRGHEVHVRTAASLVPMLRAAGLDASPVAPEVEGVPVTDFQAGSDKDRLAAGQVDLMARGRHDGPDLLAAIRDLRPDVLLVDVNAYGAQTRAEASGLPWAVLMPSVVPVPGRGIPPYGLGLRPRGDVLGRVRDRVLWSVVERMFGKAMLPGLNALRADAGLPALRTPLDLWDRPVLALTGAPLEYDRSDLPANIHLVGCQPWDVPAERPTYLDEPGDPWVLVTCSTEYQGDERLAQVAVEALAEEPVRVLVTLADAYDGARIVSGGNVRAERFVPHGHVVPEASVVVCHGGMGIVNRATSAGVPMVVVPFGRDQPEVARRATEAGVAVTLAPRRLDAGRLREAVRAARALQPSARAAAARADAAGAAGRFADAALSLATDAARA